MSSPPLTASWQSGNAYVVVAAALAVAVVHHEPREDLVLLKIEPGGAVPGDDRLLLSSGPGEQRVADDVSVLALTTEILPPETPTD